MWFVPTLSTKFSNFYKFFHSDSKYFTLQELFRKFQKKFLKGAEKIISV